MHMHLTCTHTCFNDNEDYRISIRAFFKKVTLHVSFFNRNARGFRDTTCIYILKMHIKRIPMFSIDKQLLNLFTDNTSVVTLVPPTSPHVNTSPNTPELTPLH